MEPYDNTKNLNLGTASQPASIDPRKLEALQSQMASEQNLVLGILGGAGAAVIGASLWAIITVVSKFQIGWMAVGVGLLVGYVVRLFGKGVSMPFGIVGAVFALIGCLLGNLLSVCGFVANQENLPFIPVALGVLTNPEAAFEIMKASFSPMDLVFYAIAVYEGYKFAFRPVTQEQVNDLVTPTSAT